MFRHGGPGVGMTYRGGFLLQSPSTSYLSVELSFGHWKCLPAKRSSLPQSSGTGPLFCFKTLHPYIKTLISNTCNVFKTDIRIRKSSRYFSVTSVTKICQPRAKARNWQVLIRVTQKSDGIWNTEKDKSLSPLASLGQNKRESWESGGHGPIAYLEVTKGLVSSCVKRDR